MSLISLFDLNTLLIPFSQLSHLIAVLFVKSSESAPIPFNMSLDDIWMNPCDIIHYLHLKILYIDYAHTFSTQIMLPLTKVIDIFPGRDNVVRLAKVKTDNGIFLRPIQRLFPLEISQSEDDPLPGGDLIHKEAFQKQSAYPAAGPERPSQDAASSNEPRTERVIKPPQRLDL
ncbi:hypothetical protein NPIL_656401 [Nephila pilipes]|uniref:DUF5641 domain-containing protein n=1 Tax=Nephila pilipes TaxID=299642 RepID=A0A8X6PB22_NEPPI|nr:hypothetical protein NPIL_656401 [Nephila pilipes]